MGEAIEELEMSETLMQAKLVRVRREEGKTGLFYASSPDLQGLLVAEPTLDALDRAIPGAIQNLYRASGESVVVAQVADRSPSEKSWVAFPVELAKRALEDLRAV